MLTVYVLFPEEMAGYLSSTRGIDRNKYLVVNNWQNDDDFMNLPAAKSSDKIVFEYVGSINVHANVDLMIRAFVNAKIKNSEFRIYGGGNRKDYCVSLVKELAANNNLSLIWYQEIRSHMSEITGRCASLGSPKQGMVIYVCHQS